MDIYGMALKDFSEQNEKHKLLLNTSYGDSKEMSLCYFFREYSEMTDLEKMALSVWRKPTKKSSQWVHSE